MTNRCILSNNLWDAENLTNSMEQSYYWKSDGFSSSQEIPRPLWIPMNFRFHKRERLPKQKPSILSVSMAYPHVSASWRLNVWVCGSGSFWGLVNISQGAVFTVQNEHQNLLYIPCNTNVCHFSVSNERSEEIPRWIPRTFCITCRRL
jgi:hypothetical protein